MVIGDVTCALCLSGFYQSDIKRVKNLLGCENLCLLCAV
jgi:hypothetical protein